MTSAPTPVASATELSPRGRTNLVALARLHRLVRYYHPSDKAVQIDWDRWLIDCIPAVEAAEDDAALIDVLRRCTHDLADPAVIIRPTAQPTPTTEPDPPRTGPIVALDGQRLYVALSPVDPPTGESTVIPRIERAAEEARSVEPHGLYGWVLDLRHTAGRSFASIDAQLGETLAWATPGKSLKPPRVGRVHAGMQPDHGSARKAQPFKRYDSTLIDGPSELQSVPLAVLIDETTHPAVAGWLLGLQHGGAPVVVGRGIVALAEQPFVAGLSDAIEVAFPLTRFIPFLSDAETVNRVVPNIELDLPTGLSYREILDRVFDAAGIALPGEGPGPGSASPADGRSQRQDSRPETDVAGSTNPSPRSPASQPGQSVGTPAPDARVLRLADVIAAYGLLTNFYSYWETVEADPEVLLARALTVAAADNARAAGAVHVFLSGTGDAQADLAPRDAPALVLPAVRTTLVEGKLVCTAVDPKIGGIGVGDVILRIDGMDTARRLADLAEATPGSPHARTQRCAALALAGAPETAVRLELQPAGAADRPTVTLQRGTSESHGRVSEPPSKRTLDDGIVYLDLTRLTGTSLTRAIPELTDAAGVVCDLRGTVATGVSRFLRNLTDHPISAVSARVPVRTRPDEPPAEFIETEWKLAPARPRITAPVVFLVDALTHGRAERIAELVKCEKLAALCGSRTAGAPGDTDTALLPSGARVSWTAASVVDAQGADHFYIGVAPDVSVTPTLAAAGAGRDQVVEAAVRHIKAVRVAADVRTPATAPGDRD